MNDTVSLTEELKRFLGSEVTMAGVCRYVSRY